VWGTGSVPDISNSVYFDNLGVRVVNVDELFSFERQQSSGASPVSALAATVDASLPPPGLPLEIVRSFGNTIPERYTVGPFGRGWSWSWDFAAEEIVEYEYRDGFYHGIATQVVVKEPGGGQRTFTLNVSEHGTQHPSQPGDSGKWRLVSWRRIDDNLSQHTSTFWKENIYELTEPNLLSTVS
jgi:hypothetical protein